MQYFNNLLASSYAYLHLYLTPLLRINIPMFEKP